ncbi:isoleucine--tRNA ligase [Candidatus Pacearchaeota archaeon CG_4_10_14_0_2_um_filter_30_11]|nr:MAG: isoleucine--tRNA ligase [Candidatus Pacearchaeota archaeon CG_4_10_14_0_2_um_filter_30_11]
MTDINEYEKEVLDFWEKDHTFEKSLEKTKNGKPYIFYDGPPFATGLPHYGHLLASILKDVFPRFFTMKGRLVKRNWGWDCHGLPVENVAEKELKLNSKDEIEKMGVKKFNNFCKSKVLTFASEWEKTIDRIGRWVDFENGYKTMDTDYIESVWWAFKELYEKGYLYEGEKILMYCPRCSTPLAKSEIAMDNSYKNVKDLSVVVKFKIVDEKNTYALSWTTTPWTLPSNLALTVNPKIEYAFVEDKTDKNTYLLAKELIKNFYKSEEEYTIKKIISGKDLEGKKYEPLYPYFEGTKNAFKFILGDFVTAEDGTGIVHTAPAFGEDDNLVCRKYNIPMVQPVDEKGNFTKEVTDYAGEYVHEINEKIVIDLKKSGKAILSKKVEHEYPFCYRCDTKLMYRALPAWFVDIQKIKKKLLKLNIKINWIPEFLKEGRMKHNIETAPDWNITRNRYWASAIPIWKNEEGKIKVIGSIEELKRYAKKLPKGEIDLHKDFLDDVKLEIEGKEYSRIPEVLDCWFESGSMTFAQFHYPFENKEFFEKNFPAQFVVEYIGQTRAWFYYMMVLSAILFDKIPFENVLTTGTILAEDGQKMSKSKKNYPDPHKVLEKYGADSLRFYLLQSSIMNADNFNFSEKGLEEVYKKVLILLYNVNNFYSMYKTKDDEKDNKSKEVMDKWIISRLNSLIKEVGKNLEDYNTMKASFEIKNFIEELSTWYVRNSRERFNEGDINAKKTLQYVLVETSKIIAPIMPFVAEKIFQTINGKKSSVHLENWPKLDEKKINKKLESEMTYARTIVSEGLKQRDQNNVPLKWPLSEVEVNSKTKISNELKKVIIQELNVKKYSEKLHEKDELKVNINFNLNSKLKAEGFAREISRKVQALRKKMGLNKENFIELTLEIDKNFQQILEKQKKLLKERTNSKKIEFVEKIINPRGEIEEFTIKERTGKIQIVRLIGSN